jgi:hypothetical protein
MAPVDRLAQVVDTEISRDGVDPGREPGFVLEFARVLNDPEKHLLGHVFGGLGLVELAEHEVVEGL